MNIIEALAGTDRHEIKNILTGFIMPDGVMTYFEDEVNTIYIRGEVCSFMNEYADDFWVINDMIVTPEPLPADYIGHPDLTLLNLSSLSFYGILKLYVELKLDMVINPFGDAIQDIIDLAEVIIYQYISYCIKDLAKQILNFLQSDPLYFDYENAGRMYHVLKSKAIIVR